MKPLEILTGASVTQVARNSANAERNQQGGFELMFARANQREQARANGSEQPNNQLSRSERSDTARRNRQNDEPAVVQSNSPASEVEEAYTPYAAPVAEPAEETPEAIYADPLLYIYDTDVLIAVAEAIQLPTDVVEGMLEQLGVEPKQLIEPAAVTQLLQEVYEAPTPAALLTEPDFPATYKAVNEAMAKLVQANETANAVVKTTETATVSVLVVEGLQYATQDGELVITDAPLEEEVTLLSSAQSEVATRTSSNTQSQATTAEVLPDVEVSAELLFNEPVVDVISPVANPMAEMINTRVEAVQTMQQTQQAQHVDPTDVINQIMSQVRVHTGEQVTEMRLTLRPESLGDIVLRVLTQNGIVTAQFIAESQRVREALESNFNQLRDALEEQGIQFSELSVSVRQNGDDRQAQFEQGRQSVRARAERVNALEEEIPLPIENIDFNSTINLTA